MATALITGVHTGLGLALAEASLKVGFRVLGLSRHAPKSLAGNDRFEFAEIDLTDFEAVKPSVLNLIHNESALELVVLNAGVLGQIKDLKDTSLDDIQQVLNINVWANKHIIDTLMGSGVPVDQVIAISSGAAVNGSGGWGAYSISKSALNLLIRVYAHEHLNTHFTALAPGLIRTDMLASILNREPDPRYPAIERIRSADRDERIWTPTKAAGQILHRIPDLKKYPTGAFVDIREM